MFNKTLFVAFLSLALSATAAPHMNNGNQQQQSPTCATASVVTVRQTVTVTAREAAATSKAMNNGNNGGAVMNTSKTLAVTSIASTVTAKANTAAASSVTATTKAGVNTVKNPGVNTGKAGTTTAKSTAAANTGKAGTTTAKSTAAANTGKAGTTTAKSTAAANTGKAGTTTAKSTAAANTGKAGTTTAKSTAAANTGKAGTTTAKSTAAANTGKAGTTTAKTAASANTSKAAATTAKTSAANTVKAGTTAKAGTTTARTTSVATGKAATTTAKASASTAKAVTTGKLATTSISAAKPAGTNGAAANNGNNGGKGGNNNNGNNGDPQTSLTLDPRVVGDFKLTGQETPTAGQANSLTSTNNFINFCALTLSNKPITNGLQTKTGSCNVTPMGIIAATTNMPSAKFQFPTNFGAVKANTQFTIKLAIKHLQAGTFTNAQTKYYAAPQTLNNAGDIIGHTHVTVEKISSLTSTQVSDPNVFAFFKGVNTAAVNGVVTADVTAGLPAGDYRLCSINSASTHQPVLVAVAQHGWLDDCVYFSATTDGKPSAAGAAILAGANGQNNNGQNNNGQNNNGQNNNGQNNNNQNAGKNNAAAGGVGNFGKCSTPSIKFAKGLDGRREGAFQATDLKSFNHGSVNDIGILTSFICQQLRDACGADQTAKTNCDKASAAAAAAGKPNNGAPADAFNAVFGQTTNFKAVAA